MLQSDALEQLSRLKQSIRMQKDIAEGIVRGTSGRFGFVSLDDKREAFLSPEQMQRVFPGDRIQVCVTENEEGKLVAELEKLIDSPVKHFVGTYIVRGQGHFVQPDLLNFNRWLFIPPKQRQKAKPGDYLSCKISQHPFHKDGKAQVKVLQVIGQPDQAFIEHKYIATKFELPSQQWPQDCKKQTEEILAKAADKDYLGVNKPSSTDQRRQDLSQTPFITIDSADTIDMDDALAIETTSDGWLLKVAIADPGEGIPPGSPLDRQARLRAQTVYLPGQALHMLPEELSLNTYSLLAQQQRPALVCEMRLSTRGAIEAFEFYTAVIQSKAKLDYFQVGQFLDSNAEPDTSGEKLDWSEETQQQLKLLAACSRARFEHRRQHALTMNERPDYELIINEQGKVQHIKKYHKTLGHQIVEEAMLATNICAGNFFAKHQSSNKASMGIYSIHQGFREERLTDVSAAIKEDVSELDAKDDFTQLNNYRNLIQTLQNKTEYTTLLSAFKRMLKAGQLSSQAKPHLGLGIERYATVTSPIRRYHDLHNQRVIKAIIQGTSGQGALVQETPAHETTVQESGLPSIDDHNLEQLQQQITQGRSAYRQLESWLLRQYAQTQNMVGKEYTGTVTLVTTQGIGVRLDDTGIEGYANLKENKVKLSFDQKRMRLSKKGSVYHLDQAVKVKITEVDLSRHKVHMDVLEAVW